MKIGDKVEAVYKENFPSNSTPASRETNQKLIDQANKTNSPAYQDVPGNQVRGDIFSEVKNFVSDVVSRAAERVAEVFGGAQ